MSKVEELIAETKLNELLRKKEDDKQKNTVLWVSGNCRCRSCCGSVSHMQYIVSLHRIIWKTLKMISTMILMIISARKTRYNCSVTELRQTWTGCGRKHCTLSMFYVANSRMRNSRGLEGLMKKGQVFWKAS